jgi:hypothetical protein
LRSRGFFVSFDFKPLLKRVSQLAFTHLRSLLFLYFHFTAVVPEIVENYHKSKKNPLRKTGDSLAHPARLERAAFRVGV